MKMPMKGLILAATLASGLGGCAQSQLHVGQDFGVALRQDVAAQIADPQARYRGVPMPGSDGSRVALAQDRYVTGKVIPPVAAVASPSVGAVAPGASSQK
jgi:hypothetical protein